MLRFLQQLLGRDRQSALRRPGEERRSTPRTSAASVLAVERESATAAPTPAAPVQPEPNKRPSAPELSLEDLDSLALEGQGDGINPYNTGRFKRPDAWNRIKKADDQ